MDEAKETPDEEKEALYNAQFVLFQQDVLGSEVNERFSQLLLGFAAAALAFFADKEHLGQAHSGVSLKFAATLLCLSLLAGAVQLVLAHIAAVVRSGFANKDGLASALNHLDQEARLRVIRQSLAETLATRFWPESHFIKVALAAPDFRDGTVAVLMQIRRVVQWQALLYRLQLLLAALAAVPVAIAVFA